MSDSSLNQATADDVWTVRRVLEWTIEHLTKHGCETPRLDAEILLAHACGCQRIQLYVNYENELSDGERSTMRELVKRRATLEPVAYLVGFREFFGLEFEVTPGVFIPRPDTETLVVETLELLKEMEHPRVLDVCTGSGCIPIAIAANCPAATLTAIELEADVIDVARRNVDRHGVEDRIRLLQGDVFTPAADEEPFDVITSNPPYITDDEMEVLQPDVRLHEPHRALCGGSDGLDIVRQLITQAPHHLKPGGSLLIEIAAEQAPAVVQLFKEQGSYQAGRVAKDLGGRSRVVRARTNN